LGAAAKIGELIGQELDDQREPHLGDQRATESLRIARQNGHL